MALLKTMTKNRQTNATLNKYGIKSFEEQEFL
jgi:hypothetical protein